MEKLVSVTWIVGITFFEGGFTLYFFRESAAEFDVLLTFLAKLFEKRQSPNHTYGLKMIENVDGTKMRRL